MFLKMRYVDSWSTTVGAGAGQSYHYNGNSIFDPFAAAGGHQPYGYDQWLAFYSRYRVYGSKISVSFAVQPTLALQQAANLYVVPVTNNSVVSFASLREMPRCRGRMYTPQYARGPARIKHYASTAQIWGVSKATAATNQEFSADMGADPAAPWYWWVRVQGNSEVANVFSAGTTLNYTVILTYYVVLYDRKWLEQSA